MMTIAKRLFIFALGAGALFTHPSCQKDQTFQGEETPVFIADFDFDGDGYSIRAGLGGYYMFTDFIAEADTTRSFASGRFAYADCLEDTCANTLLCELFYNENFLLIDSNMYFASNTSNPSIPVFSTSLKLTDPETYADYEVSWNVEQNGLIGGIEAYGDSVTLPLIGEVFQVNLFTNSRITDLKTYSTSTFYPAEPASCQPLKLTASYSPGDTLVHLETTDASGNSSFSGYELQWFDGISATTEREIPLSQIGSFGIAAIGNGCYATAQIFNYDTTMGTISTPLFESSVLSTEYKDQGNVAIGWRDSNHKLWRSDFGLQSTDSYFKVFSYEPYNDNEKGQPTMKIEAEVHVRMYLTDAPGVWKWLTGRIVFGVATSP